MDVEVGNNWLGLYGERVPCRGAVALTGDAGSPAPRGACGPPVRGLVDGKGVGMDNLVLGGLRVSGRMRGRPPDVMREKREKSVKGVGGVNGAWVMVVAAVGGVVVG